MLTFFCCNDMEEAWIAGICADQEREQAEWERQEDVDHEAELALECVEDDDIDSWPWYADSPHDIQEPQIFDEVPSWIQVDDIQQEQDDDGNEDEE